MKRHQPHHLYVDDQLYFVTAHTYLNRYKLKNDFERQKIQDKILSFIKCYNYELYAWVILDNHYHVLFKTRRGKDLPKLFGKIHGGYSYEMNKQENCKGRKIWQNYWDWCIR